MTDDEIRIATAEVRGWKREFKNYTKTGLRLVKWFEPDGEPTCAHFIIEHSGELGYLPDYPNDLNAMHEAILSLSAEEFLDANGFVWSKRSEYLRQLEIVVFRDTKKTECQFELVNATAAQRAEAFLRTLGKWIDESKEANDEKRH